jgi:hypothetical protein
LGWVGSPLADNRPQALLDLLQRLFDTLDRGESLLSRALAPPSAIPELELRVDTGPLLSESAGKDLDPRVKLVQRIASEYTQLMYLTDKCRTEGCKIVDAVEPVCY